MTQEKALLPSQAIDSLNWLIYHQPLLEMAIEESEKLGDAADRVTLLLDNYQSRSNCYIEELKWVLNQMQRDLTP